LDALLWSRFGLMIPAVLKTVENLIAGRRVTRGDPMSQDLDDHALLSVVRL